MPDEIHDESDGEEGVLDKKIDDNSIQTDQGQLVAVMDCPWKAPVLPMEREYEVTIMYIDDEAQIYAQPAAWRSRLNEMEQELAKVHSVRSVRHEEKLAENWTRGEVCAARFPNLYATGEASWHRGLVVDVNADNNSLTVFFVGRATLRCTIMEA